MASLQRNKIVLAVLFFTLLGCVTSRYHAGKEKPLGTDIEVTPDRIILECEFITDYEGDRSNPYGFMIHVLDNEKTVLTVSSALVLEKKDCFDWFKQSEKIVSNGQSILVRGRGNAHAPVEMGKWTHNFPKHGTFYGNGRALNFLGIRNDRGQCLNPLASDDFCSQK
jgi:hypothetical protein